MAGKPELITELYRRACLQVTSSPENWQAFLDSACRNYKCRFDEQLLIYMQKPDATAVLECEKWNRRFGRWIKKNSRGIAVFETEIKSRSIKYYFDISDTRTGENEKPVPIWQMSEQYEEPVRLQLNQMYDLKNTRSLVETLQETAEQIVDNHIEAYLYDLRDCMVSMSPVDFRDGAIWAVILDVYGVMQATGLALLVLFFVMGVVKTCGSFTEVKRPEQAFKVFVRFAIAKGLVTYGLELILAIFKIIQGVIQSITSMEGFEAAAEATIPEEIITAVSECSFLESIPLWALTMIGSLVIIVLSFIMVMTVFGRFFRLYLFTALSPIALSTFAGEPTQSTGVSFLKSYAGVCLEGAVIALSCLMFSVYASAPIGFEGEISALAMVLSYMLATILNMLMLVGTVKGADRVVREMIG